MKSRKIKFRVWDKRARRFLESSGPKFDILIDLEGEVAGYDGMELHELDQDEQGEKLNTLIVEQFTGLTDTNGKEIYEGDIVAFEQDGVSYPESDYPFQYLVTWSNEDSAFVVSDTDGELYDRFNDLSKIKVIGNIHEK